MFNESIKKRYIQEKEKEVVLPNDYLIIQFNRVEEMELELKKDISNFTTYEIIEYYKIIGFSTLESLQVLNSHFKMYTQWCLQENLVKDNQNHFLEINKEILNSCVNKAKFAYSLITRDILLNWLEQLPNAKDKFILISLFEFGKSKNFELLLESEITDFIDDNTLKLKDGRIVKVSNELKKIAEESFAEDTYYSITGNGVKTMTLLRNGQKIIKDYPNVKTGTTSFQKGRKIYYSVTRSLDYVGAISWCSANDIVESGKLHMIKERSKELNMTPLEYIYSSHIKEVENQFGCNFVRSVYSVKYKEYL